MPRPKLTEEEYKARKAERNKQYYQKTKDIIKEKYKTQRRQSIVYIIKGLDHDKVYVGVSNIFEERQKKHIHRFGDVNIEPFLRFTTVLPVYILNSFEALITVYHIGADKCININNTSPHINKDVIIQHLPQLDVSHHALISDCLKKMETSGNPERGLNG